MRCQLDKPRRLPAKVIIDETRRLRLKLGDEFTWHAAVLHFRELERRSVSGIKIGSEPRR